MDFNKAITSGLVRHALTFVGGALVTGGYIDAGQLETGIGAIIALIGIVWSTMSKKNQ